MASPVDTSVKFAYADMPGAPVLSGTAGSLITLLDAFLVTGFGLKSVDSGGTISGGVCRLPFSSGAAAVDKNAVILVAGATPAGLNGEQKVTNYSTTWVEFKTTLPDGAVTGAVSFKIAPLGWEKVFTKTNVAVYRPTDPASTRPYLRIDDTGTTFARVLMYESMTDVDTGVNMMPTGAAVVGGYYWWKRNTAVATGAQYAVIGDSRGFYYAPYISQLVGSFGTNPSTPVYAGDINSYRSGDAYCATVSGSTTTPVSATVVGNVFGQDSYASNTRFVMRRATGLGVAQSCDKIAYGQNLSGNNGPLGPAPAGADNGIYLVPIVLSDGGLLATVGVRGEYPGALSCPQTGTDAVFGNAIGQIVGTGAFSGKTLMTLPVDGRMEIRNTPGTGFFDITGPWRRG